MYRSRVRRQPVARRPRAIRGRGAYYYNPSTAFLRSRPPAQGIRILKGRGGYWGDLWNRYRSYIPRAIGAIGAGIGGLSGGPAAALAAAAAGYGAGGEYSKRILGWGAYGVADPTQSAGTPGTTIYKGNVPSMHSIEGGIRISHKEMIGTIVSSSTFTVNTYEANPGLNSWAPWLSGIARNFQQYDISGLCYVYKPTCSDALTAATISSMGSVSISTDQNVLAAPPTSVQGMLASQFSVSGKPSAELLAPVEQARLQGGKMTSHLLVRTGAVPAGATRQFYDDHVMFVATGGNGVDGTELGQLFIAYDISFYNPATLPPGSEVRTYSGHVQNSDIAHLTSAHPFTDGQSYLITDTDNIGVHWNSVDSIKLDIGNAGVYLIAYRIAATMGNQILAPFTVTNATILTAFDDNTHTMGRSPYGLQQSDAECQLAFINIPDPTLSCVITISAGSTITTPTHANLIITQVNPGV